MINDPTPLGLAISFGYLAAFLAALFAWRAQGGRFWLVCAVILAGFGLNQQLDLQSWAIELGRGWVKSSGFHAQRRAIQAGIVAAAALAAILVALPAWRWARRTGGCERLGGAGLALILLYALIRLATFAHLDPLGAASGLEGPAQAIELGGLVLLIAGGLRARLALR